jgi:hypothetical protein
VSPGGNRGSCGGLDLWLLMPSATAFLSFGVRPGRNSWGRRYEAFRAESARAANGLRDRGMPNSLAFWHGTCQATLR